MPKAPRNRKPKVKRNLAGLRNQHTPTNTEREISPKFDADGEIVHDPHVDGTDDTDEDRDWDPLMEFDSLKPCWEREENEVVDDEDSDMEDLNEGWAEPGDAGEGKAESRHVRLMKLAIWNEDDPQDEDWVPAELRKKYLKKIKRQQGV